jgi:hypothetical protein
LELTTNELWEALLRGLYRMGKIPSGDYTGKCRGDFTQNGPHKIELNYTPEEEK